MCSHAKLLFVDLFGANEGSKAITVSKETATISIPQLEQQDAQNIVPPSICFKIIFPLLLST
jgi:hypothetical protein